jgi:hypothetical protein
MATTTTNFGWDIPQSTDLVKDGATAIAALGQDIDTALVDLKGGTTGQVLAKASNTDLDYSWVAQDDSNAIQNAIVDAKGDLIGATAADTPARLAVGTNGQVLTADSTAATGLVWASPASSGGMTLINTGGTTLSGSSVTVGSIPSTYVDLYVVVRNFKPANDGQNLNMAINGDTNANRYKSDYWNDTGSATYSFDTSIHTMNYYQDNGTATGSTIAQIYDYANSSTMKLIWNFGVNNNADNPSTSIQTWNRRGWYSQTGAISSLVFSCSTGNFTSGTVFVYGVK